MGSGAERQIGCLASHFGRESECARATAANSEPSLEMVRLRNVHGVLVCWLVDGVRALSGAGGR